MTTEREHAVSMKIRYARSIVKKNSISEWVGCTRVPFVGASPDGISKYRCCGHGVLEIKYPHSGCDISFLEKANETAFFLEDSMESCR